MFKISASVGRGGANRAADVNLVQKALNLLPPSRGGPQVQLVEDGMAGEKTVGAISGFQQRVFGWADGRIDAAAQTITKLIEELQLVTQLSNVLRLNMQAYLAQVKVSGFDPEAVIDGLQLLSPFRLAVLAVALAEMIPAPYGAVNDVNPTSDTNPATGKFVKLARYGWRRLEQYVDGGFPTLRASVKREEYYRGLIERGARIEMGGTAGTSNKLHWCGVFCAWVFRQRDKLTPFVPPGKTLRDVTWVPGRLNMTPSKLSSMTSNWQYQIKPGDICHIEKQTHHFIILSYPENGKFWTINSNGYLCANEVKRWDVNLVKAWYSADSFLC